MIDRTIELPFGNGTKLVHESDLRRLQENVLRQGGEDALLLCAVISYVCVNAPGLTGLTDLIYGTK